MPASHSLATDSTAASAPLDRITGEFNAFVKASGLDSPGGLAIRPDTHDVYVTENGRISVVRDGKAVPVISTGWHVSQDMAAWLITDDRPLEYWTRPALNQPHGLAIGPGGKLYVSEDIPDGRILEFAPDPSGRYSTASVVSVPWLQYDYDWKALSVSDDGLLTVAGVVEGKPGEPPYGSVVTRDLDNNWWAVDYGVFARFTSLGLARDPGVMVVGDEYTDHVVWWDTSRHLAIGSATGKTDNIQSVGVMPDGAILALEETQEADLKARKSQIVRIDPQTQESRIVAQGFGAVGSIAVARDSGLVYVSELTSGQVLELQPKTAILTNNYLLQRSISAFEAKGGLAPRSWPSYLQNFVKKLGVDPASERDVANKAVKQVAAATAKPAAKPELTPEAFGVKVPFIAGMVKSDPTAESTASDPVQQVDFIVFFPSSAIKKEDFSTPSLSLFSARRQSGKVLRSFKLSGMSKSQKNTDGTWPQSADKTALFVPIATCAATPVDDGVDVSLCFLGLDMMDDYYMQFHLGQDSSGRLIVNGDKQAMVKYNMNLTEMDEQTGTEVPTVVMAGFNKRKAERYTWLKIGMEPQEQFLQVEEKPPWTSRWMSEQAPDLGAMMKKQDDAIRSAMRKVAEPDASHATADRRPADKLEPLPKQVDGRTAQAAPAAPPPGAQASAKTADDADADEDAAWTNMILSRAIQAWIGQEEAAR